MQGVLSPCEEQRCGVTVPTPQAVRIDLFNVLGQRLAVLYEGALDAAQTYAVAVPPRLSRGTYVVRATGQSFAETVSMVIR